MAEKITIQGETFEVNVEPFVEGHVCTAGEASALNQTRLENLRNNFASKVADAKEAGNFDLETLQSQFDEYADSYEFGVRTGGGRTGDPVMTEAMSIMRDKVRAALKKQGISLKDVSAKQISEKAKAYFDGNHPAAAKVLEVAKANVARAQSVAELELDAA